MDSQFTDCRTEAQRESESGSGLEKACINPLSAVSYPVTSPAVSKHSMVPHAHMLFGQSGSAV